MDIRIPEILFLMSAALLVASAFRKGRTDVLRPAILEPALILVLAVGSGMTGREAALAGRMDGAIATWIAAFLMALAAAIVAARQVRERQSRPGH